MPIDAATWYDPTPDTSQRYQGDVLTGVPVVLMPPKGEGPWILLRPENATFESAWKGNQPRSFRPYTEAAAPDPWPDGKELVLARGRKTTVLVITQSCDIDHLKWVQVAPVLPLSTLESAKRESVRKDEVKRYFYLPASPPPMPDELVADLSQITAVYKSYLPSATLVQRLTSLATVELQRKLSNLYGRMFGFNIKDSVPQTGSYACYRCFIRTSTVQRVEATAGTKFPPCEGCGDAALWLKPS